MPPPAYLLVFSEPGEKVTQDLFDDWYDNEHVPARVATSTFSSWVRLEAIDGQKPRFGAAYDLSSFEETRGPPYTTLWETQSDREKRIFVESELFDRRMYELYDQSPTHAPSALFDKNAAAPIMVFRGVDVKEEAEGEFIKWWLEEHVPLLSKVPGWVRSRMFVLKESGYRGVEADKQTRVPTKFMGVHEWTNADFEGHPEYKASLETPWREQVMKSLIGSERRVFKLLRQWGREE
ncbi:hypothetical protein BXZ70DRAFT_291225 [Cristinia sonorae]|uniref:EthD domain-containing protein n=1 Tax=Cristinia sonorae TaxID=1940300 RepID=A0A8K0XPA2_9AGAR|nr:hypothetical protein BXZ70DRAFT_291225 [Cristinia sonorae]